MLSFDITEAAMLAVGDDPYRHEKAEFMEETREFRAALCSAHRTARLRTALVRLPRELDEVWRDTRSDAAQRRIRVFALWDDCAEGTDDLEQAKMGAMARAIVMGFIRRHMPVGSPEAYSHDELVALNARRASRAPFAPYP